MKFRPNMVAYNKYLLFNMHAANKKVILYLLSFCLSKIQMF